MAALYIRASSFGDSKPMGSVYAIYGNIYHQYNIHQKMLAYVPYLDPMGNNHDHAKNVQTYVGKLPPRFDTNPPAIHGVVFYAIMNPYLVGGFNPSQENIWHFTQSCLLKNVYA